MMPKLTKVMETGRSLDTQDRFGVRRACADEPLDTRKKGGVLSHLCVVQWICCKCENKMMSGSCSVLGCKGSNNTR